MIEKKSADLRMSHTKRKKWCNCVLFLFKAKYPNGISKLPLDTARVAATTFSYDCLKTAIDTNSKDPLGLEKAYQEKVDR